VTDRLDHVGKTVSECVRAGVPLRSSVQFDKGLRGELPNLRSDLIADAPEDCSPLVNRSVNSLGIEQGSSEKCCG
jgi:hypothetical protein